MLCRFFTTLISFWIASTFLSFLHVCAYGYEDQNPEFTQFFSQRSTEVSLVVISIFCIFGYIIGNKFDKRFAKTKPESEIK
jgi:hypothetical protein